jgi:hypothetical protein
MLIHLENLKLFKMGLHLSSSFCPILKKIFTTWLGFNGGSNKTQIVKMLKLDLQPNPRTWQQWFWPNMHLHLRKCKISIKCSRTPHQMQDITLAQAILQFFHYIIFQIVKWICMKIWSRSVKNFHNYCRLQSEWFDSS